MVKLLLFGGELVGWATGGVGTRDNPLSPDGQGGETLFSGGLVGWTTGGVGVRGGSVAEKLLFCGGLIGWISGGVGMSNPLSSDWRGSSVAKTLLHGGLVD